MRIPENLRLGGTECTKFRATVLPEVARRKTAPPTPPGRGPADTREVLGSLQLRRGDAQKVGAGAPATKGSHRMTTIPGFNLDWSHATGSCPTGTDVWIGPPI